jgi:hypothetical protein
MFTLTSSNTIAHIRSQIPAKIHEDMLGCQVETLSADTWTSTIANVEQVFTGFRLGRLHPNSYSKNTFSVL